MQLNYQLLKKISSPHDLRNLSLKELDVLCDELRAYFIHSIHENGGHFAASLGVVELTVAIHFVFNTPIDKIIWDVGHQSHIHKLLTNRKNIESSRQKNGLAPFTDITESEYDAFGAGHACTAVSAAVGIAQAVKSQVIAVIGDGAMTGGLTFEALNYTGEIRSNLLVIYNDNGYSISKNTGALAKFNKIEKFITALGFSYQGPVDGHDLNLLINTLSEYKNKTGPQFLHIKTTKGKGFEAAEANPVQYHAVKASFSNNKYQNTDLTFTSVFGDWVLAKAAVDKKLQVITPAMITGSGLELFAHCFPNQLFDVGIAEQHAVTMAAGMASHGLKPIVAIYSTFLQRGFDSLIHDVALQNLAVIFAIDRAGCVGYDGSTHMGSFDLSYLNCIPNLTIFTPSNGQELKHMLDYAYQQSTPVAIRYPKASCQLTNQVSTFPINRSQCLHKGKKMALLVFGSLVSEALLVGRELNISVFDMRIVKPIDKNFIRKISSEYKAIITVEENSIIGGAGSRINEFLVHLGYNGRIYNFGLPDKFIRHASRAEQLAEVGLDRDGLAYKIKPLLIEVK